MDFALRPGSADPPAEGEHRLTESRTDGRVRPVRQSSLRNSSTVRPASRTIPPLVNALIGLCRGTHGDLASTVAHDDVLALPDDSKSDLLQRTHRVLVVDSEHTGHR